MAKQAVPPLLTDEELAALAVIASAGREDATRMWRADAPRGAKEILDAEEAE